MDVIVSLNVKMSVFDGMESAARIGQAEKDAESAGLGVRQAEKIARLAVRRAVDAAVKAEADLSERQAQEEYAAERLKNAQVSVQNGMSSREDLHGAEILFGSAQLDRLLAQFTREEVARGHRARHRGCALSITDLSVRRPTAILMGVALIVGLGVVGYVNLGADLFPAVNTPVISIHSAYAGAGAEEVDKEVIKPIEDAVSGINGIDTIRSTSGTGFGYTILQFTMSTDMNSAVIDVQKALDGVVDTPAQGSHAARHGEVRREQPADPDHLRHGIRHSGRAFRTRPTGSATTWKASRAWETRASSGRRRRSWRSRLTAWQWSTTG